MNNIVIKKTIKVYFYQEILPLTPINKLNDKQYLYSALYFFFGTTQIVVYNIYNIFSIHIRKSPVYQPAFVCVSWINDCMNIVLAIIGLQMVKYSLGLYVKRQGSEGD